MSSIFVATHFLTHFRIKSATFSPKSRQQHACEKRLATSATRGSKATLVRNEALC